jgi:gliding motility-associated-like protein
LITHNNSYLWSFGQNGHLANSVLNVGNNSITLRIENLNNSCRDTLEQNIEIFKNPVADFLAVDACLGESVNFSDNSSSNIITWSYDFGDGIGASADQNPIYTYTNPGVYNVILSITSDRGCESMLGKKIIIHKLPSANFKVLSDICLGNEVEISYLSDANDANVAAWNYIFGDGNFSTEQNPTHAYNYLSSFDVSLDVVSSEGCKNDTIMPAIIETHNFPIADFQASTLFASELSPKINFYNHSEGAIFFEWNFDNGEYSFEENPTFIFNNPQIYNVALTATNDIGCSSKIIQTVQINPEYTFFIPDAFTPDGDGLNDVFIAQGNRISSFEMQVFDRWGGVIFESSSIDLGWDGNSFTGEELGDGIYLYHITLYDINQRLWVYNGELKLMR